VQLRRIAGSHGIPARFLVQILQQLKAAGVITTVRGASGGYLLAKPPDETSLGEVIALIEGPNSHGLIGAADSTPVGRVLLNKWQEIAHAETQILESTTLADLVAQVQDEAALMYYI
jgi:Rrf2 family protein